MPGSIPGRACRPSCSEFYLIFSETHVNTSQDPLEKPLWKAFPHILRTLVYSIGLIPTTESNTIFLISHWRKNFLANATTSVSALLSTINLYLCKIRSCFKLLFYIKNKFWLYMPLKIFSRDACHYFFTNAVNKLLLNKD